MTDTKTSTPGATAPACGESGARLYEVYRLQIEHEDELIGLRVGWFIAAEALLFAAYGVVLTVQPRSSIFGTPAIDGRVLNLVPYLGMVMAVMVGAAIGAAMHQMERLSRRYIGHCIDNKGLRAPTGYPDLWASDNVVELGHLPAASLAPILICAWCYVRWGGTGVAAAIVAVIVVGAAFYAVHVTLLVHHDKLRSRKDIKAARKRLSQSGEPS